MFDSVPEDELKGLKASTIDLRDYFMLPVKSNTSVAGSSHAVPPDPDQKSNISKGKDKQLHTESETIDISSDEEATLLKRGSTSNLPFESKQQCPAFMLLSN